MASRRPALRRTLSLCATGVAAAVCLLASAAAADGQGLRAAALVPQVKRGAATSELRDKFHDAVVRGLSSLTGPSGPSGELGEVVTAVDARTRLGEELASCGGEAPCLARALAALRVNRLIATDLSVNGKSYAIAMRLYDGQGHEITHADDACDICTVREADEALTRVANRLAAAARTFPVEAVAAEHARPVERLGASPTPQPTAIDSVGTAPSPSASPMTDTPPIRRPSRERSRFPWRAAGFASLGAGIIGLAVGIPLLVIDGHPTCNATDPAHACPRLYSTRAGGAIAVSLGTLGLVAAVPLLCLDYRDRRGPVSSLQIGGGALAGGGRLTLEGRF